MLNLLGKEQILWTVPAPVWAREAVADIRNFEQFGEEDKAEELKSKLPNVVQLRLTMQSATIVEDSYRDELLFSVRDIFESEYGTDPGTFSRWFQEKWIKEEETGIVWEGSDKLTKEDAFKMYNKIQRLTDWCNVIACLDSVSIRTIPMREMLGEKSPEGGWEDSGVPDEWKDYDSFIASVPNALFEKMVDIANGLNPSVWSIPGGEDAKKFGGVSTI
jgi:hypothetical protein